MKLKESAKVTEPFKARYRDNILEIVRKREIECAKARREYRKDIFKNPEKYREEFIKMLGWPLGEKRDTVPTRRLLYTRCSVRVQILRQRL